MKVNSTPSNPLAPGVTGTARQDSTARSGKQASVSSTAVDLSPAARNLAALQDDKGDVRPEQVRQIRDALASGQLQIDASKIADGLLASVRDLLK